MHRNFVLLFSALVILLVPRVDTWAADRIVLKDGNVVEGEIIRTTTRDITLKGRFGMITFPLKRVRRVREDGKYWSPPEAPEEDEEAEDGEHELGWGESRLKQRLLRTIQEIEANPIGEWTSHPKEPARSKVDHPYRLLKNGAHIYSDRLPLSAAACDQVWAHRREQIHEESGGISRGSSVTVAGARSAYWVPLYWHENTGRWLPTHPFQSAFRWEENQVTKMLARLANSSGRGNANRVESVVEKLTKSPEQHHELKRKLRQLTTIVAGEWRGDELLYRVYLTNLAISHASAKEKVDLVRSRRAELRQLMSIVP